MFLLLIPSEKKAIELNMPILASIRGFADAETDPNHFTIAPSLAVPKALAKAGNPKVCVFISF
jgi:acetyl-CoA C-acetyltransferase